MTKIVICVKVNSIPSTTAGVTYLFLALHGVDDFRLAAAHRPVDRVVGSLAGLANLRGRQ